MIRFLAAMLALASLSPSAAAQDPRLVGDWSCEFFGLDYGADGRSSDRYGPDGVLVSRGFASLDVNGQRIRFDAVIVADWRLEAEQLTLTVTAFDVSSMEIDGQPMPEADVLAFEQAILADPASTSEVIGLADAYFVTVGDGLLTTCRRATTGS